MIPEHTADEKETAGPADAGAPADPPASIRCDRRVPEAWLPVRDLVNAATMRLHAGAHREGIRMLRRAVAATDAAVAPAPDAGDAPDTPAAPARDAAGADLRARALANLSSALEWRGDLAGALDAQREAVRAATSAIAGGVDAYGTRSVLVTVLLSHAGTLSKAGRPREAGAAVDRAECLLAERRGDDGARDLLAGSQHLQRDADLTSGQLAAENAARAALADGRIAEARDGFVRAERLALDAGMDVRAAASRAGLAAAWLHSGRVGRAVRALEELIPRLEAAGADPELRELHAFIGDAQSIRARYDAAEAAYLASRELATTVHDRCRIDLRLAEMHAERAALTPGPRSRVQRLERARDLAVPVLLAVSALRDGFAVGGDRERWAATVEAPARELAFRLASTLDDAQLLWELVEHETAATTFRPATVEGPMVAPVVEPEMRLIASLLSFAGGEDGSDAGAVDAPVRAFDPGLRIAPETAPVPTLPPAPAAATALPAAAGLAGDGASGGDGRGTRAEPGDGAALRLARPPRVIPAPGAEPALLRWIALAERAYGVHVRSDRTVAGW